MTQDSIYYHKPGHLREFVKRIADKSISIPEAFSTYREIRVLPNKFRSMTVAELSNDPRLIQELSKALSDGMQPESKYKLPYNKSEREKELIESISESYDIDKSKAKSKVITGHYKDSNSTQEFNYLIEVVVAPRKDLDIERHAGEVEFVGDVNPTPSIDGGENYFSGGPFEFRGKDGEIQKCNSISDVLHKSGFTAGDYYGKTKKKVPSVVVVNLRTPVPDWLGSAGKTRIDLNPYARDIAKTVYSLSKSIPSYHPRRREVIPDFYVSQKEATQFLIEFLRERDRAIKADPSLKTRDRLTQSGVWYRIRPKMIAAGFKPNKNWGITRESLTNKINDKCKEYFGKQREAFGIVAAARATMLYHGLSIPVTIDNLQALAKNGVVVIVIEKEGIADVIADQAQRYGVALIHTQGRLTEYGKDLIEVIKSVGGIVAILVDFDLVGQRIVRSTRTDTPTIGINKETVTWLQQNGYPSLTVEQVQEEYSIKLTAEDELYKDEIDPYLFNRRIELDSIVAQVGADGLWKYIMQQIKEQLAPFDYRDEVSMPPYESLYSKEMADLLTYFNDYTAGMVNEEESNILDNELSKVGELLDVEKTEEDIQDRFNEIADKDGGYKTISSKVKELLEYLPKPKLSTNNDKEGEGS